MFQSGGLGRTLSRSTQLAFPASFRTKNVSKQGGRRRGIAAMVHGPGRQTRARVLRCLLVALRDATGDDPKRRYRG
jgi:hypothetical protein